MSFVSRSLHAPLKCDEFSRAVSMIKNVVSYAVLHHTCGATFDKFRERDVKFFFSVNFRRLKTG